MAASMTAAHYWIVVKRMSLLSLQARHKALLQPPPCRDGNITTVRAYQAFSPSLAPVLIPHLSPEKLLLFDPILHHAPWR